MAADSVSNDTSEKTVLSLNVPPKNYFEREWEGSKLPHGVEYKMTMLDEAVCGLDGLTALLRTDAMHRCSLNDHGAENIEYVPLNSNIVFGLYSAQRCLIKEIGGLLESVRTLAGGRA